MPDRHAWAASTRLNSKKSSTYGIGVEHRIIERKGSPAAAEASVPAPARPPATRHVRIEEDSAGQRLDNFLVKLLKGVPKTHVYRVIRSGEVRVNKGRAGADTRLALGDEVRVPPVRTAAPDDDAAAATPPREFPVVFEDDCLIAVDKPAGVAVHGGSGVSFGVIEQLRRARPDARFLELVHRLDKDTSGLLLLAKKRSALLGLQEQMRATSAERSMAKSYTALVAGRWPASRKVVDVALHKYIDAGGERRVRTVEADHADGRRSITLVRVARLYDGWTLLDVTLKTGRTHQIRVHLADAGHPVAGDDKYGDRAQKRALARGTAVPGCRFERMFLHASRLRFAHPATGATIDLEARLPAACVRLLDALDAGSAAQ